MNSPLFPGLARYLMDGPAVHPARASMLSALVDAIQARSLRTDVVFVCTHNSRRSQIAQVMAAATAIHIGIDVTTWSAGTAVTACHANAVAALQRAGVQITAEKVALPDNPLYACRLGPEHTVNCWSKRFDDPTLPAADSIAVMVCAGADEACPTLPAATSRIPLRYTDPRHADGTRDAGDAYDTCVATIASEMMWVMSAVATAAPRPANLRPPARD